MAPPKKKRWGELSDEELGRLVRESLNQNGQIEDIKNTNTISHENWFQRQLKTNHVDRLVDGLQHKAEEDLGIDEE